MCKSFCSHDVTKPDIYQTASRTSPFAKRNPYAYHTKGCISVSDHTHSLTVGNWLDRSAYNVLVNTVPQLLSISNPLGTLADPLSISPSPLYPQSTTRDPTWPKESDFTREERNKLYWTKNAWTNREKSTDLDEPRGKKGKSRAAQGINVKLQFIVDRSGNPVDGHRANKIREVARSIWAHLSAHGIAPESWGTAGLVTTDMYRTQMETRLEELRLCEGGWKAQQIAFEAYPSWRSARLKNGTFNSKGLKIEDDDDDEEFTGNNTEDEKENIPAKRKNKSEKSAVKKLKANPDDGVEAVVQEVETVPLQPLPQLAQVRFTIFLDYPLLIGKFIDQ